MADRRASFGKLAEDMAAEYLVGRGCEVMARNYRARTGEIDIVVSHEGWIIFAEVKARSAVDYGYPREAVTREKQRRLVKTAAEFLAERELSDCPVRFDVVEVYGGKLVHWPNAFDATDL